ncbi:helix-turn-helix domain-containing protein [Streptomyces malaysiensis]|uniref:helix-turn-helix domain-containing protein n=1 Tax=Streptomyces malaysiensis TaxID=92644 RepID=UPI002B2CFD77|nr:helix-turn-helix transcriptional regulator [Streptomyces malaysiensis]
MLTTFRDLGALPGASCADVELRAADDHSVVAGGPADTTTLTPQELEIIGLAADDLTGGEIGRRLYLLPRIIGNHLLHAFPKLGVTSRVHLRDALNCPITSDAPHHRPGAVRQCLDYPAPAEGDDAADRRT